MSNLSNLSSQEMRNACHALAAQVMHTSARTNRCKGLRETVIGLVKDDAVVKQMTGLDPNQYPYAEVPTEYLAAVLKAYDEEEVA